MTGQYQLTNEEEKTIKSIIEKHITSYCGDLYEDNEITIQFAKKKDFDGESWTYIQMD